MEKKNQSTNQPKKETNDPQGRSGLNDYFKYAGMGVQMLAIIGIFTWAGIKLDARSTAEKPLFTAILALLGVVIGIYSVLKDFIHKE
ncbi:MAG: AtpZ/AtpI family protein [Bacteroidales bacterium]